MAKLLNYFIVIFLLCVPVSIYSQNDIKAIIHKRDSNYSIYQRTRVVFNEDSLSSKMLLQLKSTEQIIEQDNLIIDLINEKLEVFTSDTTRVGILSREINSMQKELDDKSSVFAIFLVLSIVTGGLMILFLLLYVSAIFSKKNNIAKLIQEKEQLSKLLNEREELEVTSQEESHSYSKEYQTLKELSDRELGRFKETQELLKLEIVKYKDDFIKAEEIAHLAKEENSKLIKEIDDLREMLKQLSNIPREKIEEMELNFLKIEKLAQLFDIGTISEGEYEIKKNEFLNEI